MPPEKPGSLAEVGSRKRAARKWPGQMSAQARPTPRAHAPVPSHPAPPVIQSAGWGGGASRPDSSSPSRTPAGVGLSLVLFKSQA